MNIDTIRLYEERCRSLKSSFNENSITGDMNEYYGMLNNYLNFNDLMSYDAFKDVLRHKTSRRNKRYRVNKKLTKLMDYKLVSKAKTQALVFATLTLTNETLYKKNGQQKKIRTITKKIDKYVNEMYDYAIINVDYGEKNERLHFHLIGQLKQGIELIPNKTKSKKGFKMYNIKNDTYKLGYSTIEIINLEDNKRTTNYLLKINNHSNKPTAINHRIRVLGNLKNNVEEHQKFLEKLFQK